MAAAPLARLGGLWGSDLDIVTDDLAALDGTGRWAVVVPYDEPPVLARFGSWTREAPAGGIGQWVGPPPGTWSSSMGAESYVGAVERVRSAIADGTVYQVNVCRVLSAPLADPDRADVAALDVLLAVGNPSAYGGFVRLPEQGVHVATASPELFVRVSAGPAGRAICTGPIKGTARTAAAMSDKDRAENVMIVDLMRNDLGRVCVTGSVEVPALLRVEEHPGLVHLVSDVIGTLRHDVGWVEIIDAAFPPGSVTGAPKSTACQMIADLEPAARGPYCGAVGWVDADTGEAELAVAIRTFWLRAGEVHFGTGAGITWGSDAQAEWAETQLKADRLLQVAARTWSPAAAGGWTGC